MADARRNDHVFSSEVGIPSGLNRIKTPRVLLKEQPSSKPGELNESRTSKNKQKSVARGHGQKSGKKMARWLLSYISRNSTQAFNNVTNIEVKLNVLTFLKHWLTYQFHDILVLH